MKILLTTLSPLLTASGESSAHIDADVKYDKYGLPYISGKTFKGLLRESAIEVCEMLGKTGVDAIIDSLFGKGGGGNGVLMFSNLKVPNYSDVVSELGNAPELSPHFVKTYFTTVIKQTTINDEGIAADKSLRTYRLISKGQSFEGIIENYNNVSKDILDNAILNLRYIGTRRNRGFGKVKIREIASTPIVKPSSITAALTGQCKLTYVLKTISPLQISKQIGDQNTTATEDHIPAQNIRGLIAGLLIKTYANNVLAHNMPEFKDLILNNNVKYGGAFPSINDKVYAPAPCALGYEKLEQESERKIYNSIEKRETYKSIKNWCNNDVIIEGKKKISTHEVALTSNFHSSRQRDRIAGRSTKEEGDIFYYESIEEGQTFRGEITGEFKDLERIKTFLESNNSLHRMGRSKTAQYSEVEFLDIQISKIQASTVKTDSNFYIVFQSPVIVYTEFGIAIPDIKFLKDELKSYNIDLIEIASRNTLIENYMGIWKSKTNRENGFAMGTTLLVKPMQNQIIDITMLLAKGLGERTNEGYGRVEVLNLEEEYETIKADKPLPTTSTLEERSEANLLIDELKNFFTKEEEKNTLKINAIDKAKKYEQSLNNHETSRLKEKLNSCENIKDWQIFLKSIKSKKLGLKIEAKHLWADLFCLNINPSESDFNKKKLFWETFFNVLRKKSKREK